MGARTEIETQIPDWMPMEAWNAYLDMRKKIKKPMTEYAKYLACRQLQAMKEKGQDIEAVINKSVQHSWSGLYEIAMQHEKKTSSGGLPWWHSEQTIVAKGREFALYPRPGESLEVFKGRVHQKIIEVNAK